MMIQFLYPFFPFNPSPLKKKKMCVIFSSPFLLLVFLLFFLIALCLIVINDFYVLASSAIAEGQVKLWTSGIGPAV